MLCDIHSYRRSDWTVTGSRLVCHFVRTTVCELMRTSNQAVTYLQSISLPLISACFVALINSRWICVEYEQRILVAEYTDGTEGRWTDDENRFEPLICESAPEWKRLMHNGDEWLHFSERVHRMIAAFCCCHPNASRDSIIINEAIEQRERLFYSSPMKEDYIMHWFTRRIQQS